MVDDISGWVSWMIAVAGCASRVQMRMLFALMVAVEVVQVQLVGLQILGWGAVVMALVNGQV